VRSLSGTGTPSSARLNHYVTTGALVGKDFVVAA